MALVVSLSISKTDLIIGEDPPCLLKLENNGSEPISLVEPDSGGGMPSYRVIEVKTGIEIVRPGARIPTAPPMTRTLEPGDQLTAYVPLLRDVPLNVPGEFLVSAVYSYEGSREPAESEPIKINVRPHAARHLGIDRAAGFMIHGVSVNPAGETPQVVLTRFMIGPGGGMQGAKQIASATLNTKPILSLPPNQTPTLGHWIGWLEPGALVATHADSMSAADALAPGKFKLGGNGASAEVIPPLYIVPNDQPGTRSDGAALLWIPYVDGRGSTIQIVQLSASNKKASLTDGASSTVSGGRPLWATNQVRADGERCITMLRKDGDQIRLYRTAWPGDPGAGHLEELYNWPGEFIAAGVAVDSDDAVCGAVLLWFGGDETRQLLLLGWKTTAKGATTETYRAALPWSSQSVVEAATIRVRPAGQPAVLLRGQDGVWYMWNGFSDELVVLPEPYTQAKRPVDFAFMGPHNVALICAEAVTGFSVKQLDGSDLPPPMS